MKKKMILLIIFLFAITGCTTQYDLTIDESSFDESITVKAPKNEFTGNDIKVYSQQDIPITQETGQTRFYNNSMTEDNSNYYLKFNYLHDINTITKSYFITNCYQNANISETDEDIKISTSSEFMCINMDEGWHNDAVQINITTDLKVIENNADEINDNTYTWNINTNNYTNKPINLTIQKKTTLKKVANDIEKNMEKNSASKDLFIIYGGIALLLILVILFIKLKLKKNNQI